MIDYSPYNKIEDYLYMGEYTVAIDASILRKLNIKHILSIIDEQIPQEMKVQGITYKHINADDSPEIDLLTYFPESYLFIWKAQQKNENVYVHCHAGVSRSATIVISFIMKKYSMSFNIALGLVKTKRDVCPNYGFCNQLDLYEQMGYKIDANNRKFRKYLFVDFMNCLIFNINHNSFSVALKNYFAKLCASETETVLVLGPSYQCSKCSDKLFNDINIVKNTLSIGSMKNCCSDMYIEPRKWMVYSFNGITNDNRIGIIKCHCNNVLADYDFRTQASRCQCPLHKSDENVLVVKVNKQNIVQA